MPKGMPVATFAIGTAGAANAALFAVAMLADERRRAAQPARGLPRPPDRSRAGDERRAEVSPRRSVPGPTRVAGAPFIAPGATLGVLGGGQLGRMFVHAAQRMGYRTAVLDPDADQPGRHWSRTTTSAPTTSTPPAWPSWPSAARAVTTEFENVPAARAGARWRAAGRWRRGADAVAVCQDRAAEKAQFVALRRAVRAARGDRAREQTRRASPTRCCPAS